jgi:pyruvate dehydrogenase E2 component (dihydrolipoamide acetyltransferase)
MPVDVTMPKLSDTMEEGKILKWLKRPGDRIAIGDVIAEVETDKANMELEAYDEGVLAEVRVEEGQSAPVGAVIAVLSESAEAKPTATGEKGAPPQKVTVGEKPGAPEKPAATEAVRSQAPVTKAEAPPREARRPTLVRKEQPEARDEEHVKASPLARRIAREHGLDLRGIAGSGPGGRVVEKDVETALGGKTPISEPRPAEWREPAAPPARPVVAAAGGRVELSRIRRTTAKRMGEAKREIPHFYASAEIRMDEAARLKESLVSVGAEYVDVTYTHLLVKAVGLALRHVPEVNGSYDGDAIVLHEAVNVGVATAVDEGLVVPVVRNADREPLAAIIRIARGLFERARSGRFGAEDLSGGTFTLSNLGMLPVTEFAAVINPPQAAILAVGAIREVPVVCDGEIVPGRVMTVTLSCDHRAIDGVLAGRFLRELKARLENPLTLVL